LSGDFEVHVSEWNVGVVPAGISRPVNAGIRVQLAVKAGHTVAALSRMTGRGAGGVIGGRVILKMAPDAPRVLSAGRTVFLVSGTNGKTSTSALLTAALRSQGPVVTNADGANTAAGFVTTLAGGLADTVVLETDEGWLPWAVWQTRAAAALLLNLSRDQLSRHHEVGKVASSWRQVMRDVPLVIANVDDPHIVWPALAGREQVWVAAGQLWSRDSVACPRCGSWCQRKGESWACRCGLVRPKPTWWLEGDDLVGDAVRLPLRLRLPGRFNRANAAMAVAAAACHGIDPKAAVAAMRGLTDVAGRYAVQEYQGHQVRLLLAKNPAGWLETLQLVSQGDAPLVLAFNSNGVDGRDPSWLYDVSFHSLAGRRIIVIGQRSADMEVRLKMDDIECVSAGRHLLDALAMLAPGPVDVLANYTAFQDVRRELAHAEGQ
jgi:UDP-N-acetylmuramyl tripeptide synthase